MKTLSFSIAKRSSITVFHLFSSFRVSNRAFWLFIVGIVRSWLSFYLARWHAPLVTPSVIQRSAIRIKQNQGKITEKSIKFLKSDLIAVRVYEACRQGVSYGARHREDLHHVALVRFPLLRSSGRNFILTKKRSCITSYPAVWKSI